MRKKTCWRIALSCAAGQRVINLLSLNPSSVCELTSFKMITNLLGELIYLLREIPKFLLLLISSFGILLDWYASYLAAHYYTKFWTLIFKWVPFYPCYWRTCYHYDFILGPFTNVSLPNSTGPLTRRFLAHHPTQSWAMRDFSMCPVESASLYSFVRSLSLYSFIC